MNENLIKAFQYYLDHQEKLVKKYNGKFIVIKDGKVLGSYDDELKAVEETSKDFEIGTFLVQFVSPGDSAYTQNFYSRVAIS